MIGKTIDISVTSVLQTTAGKMIFGKWDERAVGRHDTKSSSPAPVAVPPASGGANSSSDVGKKTSPLAIDRAVE